MCALGLKAVKRSEQDADFDEDEEDDVVGLTFGDECKVDALTIAASRRAGVSDDLGTYGESLSRCTNEDVVAALRSATTEYEIPLLP